MDLGSYVEVDGRPAVRFERVYPHPIERVWRAISEPGKLAGWFPSAVTIEPRPGGTVSFSADPNLTDSTGRVMAYEPPRKIAFTWGGDELHLTLEPAGAPGTRLTLVNVLEDPAAAARNAAGWAVCLAELDRVVGGHPGDGPHGPAATARWRLLYDAHLAAGLPGGAPVPDSA
ncbi:SRPBCC family protein [Frankia sp. AgB32]|uniref:SRPBCC family protein n=1 Tax=Frankia sp. AgB32 TaxID=631119 RepID=UPI00200FECF3|nr:SRPBCC family protein [Frankia sp. AgB32]MCK9898187.1 SRPBCC family protein [Frankia sp. AgB32]